MEDEFYLAGRKIEDEHRLYIQDKNTEMIFKQYLVMQEDVEILTSFLTAEYE